MKYQSKNKNIRINQPIFPNNMYDGMLFRYLIISLLDAIRNLLKIRDEIPFRHTCCCKVTIFLPKKQVKPLRW